MTWHTKWTLSSIFGLSALLAPASQTQADVISTFNASGAFVDGSYLSGTVTIDTTTGTTIATDLIANPPQNYVSGLYPLVFNSSAPTSTGLSTGTYSSPGSSFTETRIENDQSGFVFEGLSFDASMLLWLPTPTLMGYRGGTLIPAFPTIPSEMPTEYLAGYPWPNEGDALYDSGFLSPAGSFDTPEPATFVLLAAGLLAIAGIGQYRWRRGSHVRHAAADKH
jgi:hypothetical protein